MRVALQTCKDVKFVCHRLGGLRYFKFFKEKIHMTDSFEIISFQKQSKTKIGKVTYIINSYFDNNGGILKEKIKNLLVIEIEKKSEQMAL